MALRLVRAQRFGDLYRVWQRWLDNVVDSAAGASGIQTLAGGYVTDVSVLEFIALLTPPPIIKV
jgi:hypothetical protein